MSNSYLSLGHRCCLDDTFDDLWTEPDTKGGAQQPRPEYDIRII